METTIGIKVADGTFYPVLEDGYVGDKRLVLTTVRDGQSEVHIDLYRGSPEVGIPGCKYIGSLIIENIRSGPKGSPDVELVVGTSLDGNLNVSAKDRSTGEEQSLSVSLRSMEEEGEFDIPDFAVAGPAGAEELGETPEPEAEEPREPPDDYAAVGASIGRIREEPRRRSALAIALFVIVGLAVIGAVAYVVYRSLQGPGVPALEAGTQPAAAQPAAAQPAAAQPAAAEAEGERGVRYRVKWGDTLWDLSSAYYRDPWLYPLIAKANAIPNPDRIFVGTTIFIPER